MMTLQTKEEKAKGKASKKQNTKPWVFNERKFRTCKIINKASRRAGLFPSKDHVLCWKWREGSCCVTDHGNLWVNCFCFCFFVRTKVPFMVTVDSGDQMSLLLAPVHIWDFTVCGGHQSPKGTSGSYLVFHWKWVGKEPGFTHVVVRAGDLGLQKSHRAPGNFLETLSPNVESKQVSLCPVLSD